ncbi:Protein kinase domain containing protein, partial [Reticulomyxa filosa]
LSKKEEEAESWRNYVPEKNILEGEKRAYMEYKNLKSLGGTAMARVYRAKRDSRTVTLKLYVTTRIESTTKFTNEVKILHTISHPNIIKLYDCWADNKYYYLEMEYCSGGDLWTYLQNHGRVSETFARQVGHALLDVLSALHKMRYCHRDLKPENIVLTSKKHTLPDIRLIDFGEAMQVSKDQLYVNTTSNPCYFAPELWKSMITGREFLKADVWSVGIIVFELLNGRRCFTSDLPHILRVDVAQFNPKFSQTGLFFFFF